MPERDPIDVIREQLTRAEALAGLNPDQDAFIQWQSETKAILETIFSPKSIHCQTFTALKFREVSVKAFSSPEIDKINAARFKRDLESARNILNGAIKELTLDRTLFKKIQTTPKTVEVALKGEYFVASEISDSERVQAIEGVLEGSGLKPIRAHETDRRMAPLSERIDQIRRARFGIYDLSAPEKSDVLLELGIALGLGREAIVIHQKGCPVLEGIQSLDRVEYESLPDLIEKLKKRLKL